MRKNLFKILPAAVLCVGLAVPTMSAGAATPDEAAALARSMGLPESLIQAGWNRYYEDPELYPPELIDSYMATLRGMNQDMIDQLLADSGYAPSTPPPAATTAAQSPTQGSVTTAVPSGGGNTPSGGNTENGNGSGTSQGKDTITLTLPDGSTFERISAKDFAAMSLDEKRAYIASLTPDQQSVFVANLSPEDYKSLLKQLPLDNKAEIIDQMAGVTEQLGLTLSVDELSDSDVVLSMRDENGKLVAMSSARDSVAATGYDRRGIFALAASLVAVGVVGAAVMVKKSFGKKKEDQYE